MKHQVKERTNGVKKAPSYQAEQAVKEKEGSYTSQFNIGDGIFYFMCLLFLITVTSAVATFLL